MKSPVQSCKYKTKEGQCLKGWYMIPIINDDGKLEWKCPDCKKVISQRMKKLLP